MLYVLSCLQGNFQLDLKYDVCFTWYFCASRDTIRTVLDRVSYLCAVYTNISVCIVKWTYYEGFFY